MTYDVAIVGCGPVGATVANLLGRAGHHVAVIEAKRAIYDKPRAIALDHEALRVFQHCGLLDEILPFTTPHPGTNYLGCDDQVIKRFNPLPPPYPLGLPPTVTFVQPEVDAVLRRGLDRFANVETFIPQRATAIDEQDEIVTVTMHDEETGAEGHIQARYVIGADGANSIVRQTFALPVEDLAFDEWWMVVDVHLKRDTALPDVVIQYCRPQRPATFVIGPGRLRRWEIKLLPGETPQDFAAEEQILAHLEPFVARDAVEIWRAAVYRFNARNAETWGTRRCFLAGDAAHQTPPFLGQGLCCGLRDAGNLAWKLSRVLDGRSGPGLLETYTAERKPHMRALVATAKEFGLIIGELDEAKARARDAALEAELQSGRAVQIRQRFIPDLTEGLIDRSSEVSRRVAGSLFVQPRIRLTDGSQRLLDDVVRPGFMLVSQDHRLGASLSTSAQDCWRDVAGEIVAIMPDAITPERQGDDASLVEADGLFARWLKDNGCRYAVVRPDRYVYGAAADLAELEAQIESLARRLRA